MNKTDIKGIWSGVPMPWKDSEQLDREALVRTLRRCVETGSHGIYVAGTTGEFHSMVTAQFRDVVETFADEMRNHPNVGTQVGCGSFSLGQICERIKIAVDVGCCDIQLPLPGWMPLKDAEVLDFFRAVADRFPDLRIYVYDNAACGRVIGEVLWPRLVEQIPCIAGAKLTSPSPDLVRTILDLRPEFNILGGEPNIVDLWPYGVRSIAAWISYAFPKIIADLWWAFEQDDAAAIAMAADRLDIIHKQIKDPMRSLDYREGIMDRLMGVATGFLDPVYCRVLQPWRSVAPEDVVTVRAAIERHLGAEYLL